MVWVMVVNCVEFFFRIVMYRFFSVGMCCSSFVIWVIDILECFVVGIICFIILFIVLFCMGSLSSVMLLFLGRWFVEWVCFVLVCRLIMVLMLRLVRVCCLLWVRVLSVFEWNRSLEVSCLLLEIGSLLSLCVLCVICRIEVIFIVV